MNRNRSCTHENKRHKTPITSQSFTTFKNMWISKNHQHSWIRAWHYPPKIINGMHWTSPHIELQHTLNYTMHQTLLHVELYWPTRQILLRCVSSCIALQTLLCYIANFVMLCCITLHLNSTTLHCKFCCITLCCVASFIALQTLLCYHVILLCYVTNSIVVHYIASLLHYVANSVALCYEV
jgi:hypothetical protein